MSFKSLFKIACALFIVALVKAEIEVTVVNAVPGLNSDSNRLLAKSGSNNLACQFFLLNKYMLNNPHDPNFTTVKLNVRGPPYDGSEPSLNFPTKGSSFTHDLAQIVFEGDHCECTVTIYQKESNLGRSKDFTSSGFVGSIILDQCWARKAESIAISCNV